MYAMDVVKEAARRSGTATISIGPSMGRSRSYVASKASRGDQPQANTLAAMLGACGWSLVAVPDGDVPESGLVIE